MLEFLEKFNNLPSDVKEKISSGAALAQIDALEKKYGVPLAAFIIKVTIGELYYKNLLANLIIEFNLAPEAAAALEKELQEKIFLGVMDYLSSGKSARAAVAREPETPFFVKKSAPSVGISPLAGRVEGGSVGSSPALNKSAVPGPVVRRAPVSAAPTNNFLKEDEKDIAAFEKKTASLGAPAVGKNDLMLAEIIKEANISFPSEGLTKRFKEIISTYLRGVRTKIEVREILLKETSKGGIKMEDAEADRVMAIAAKKLAFADNQFASGPGKVSARTTGDGTSFVFNEEEIKQALKEREMGGKPKSIDFGARDVAYDLSALSKKSAPSAASAEPVAVSLTGIPPQVKKEAVIMPKADSPKAPVEKKADINAAVPVMEDNEQKRTITVASNKKRMEDIKSAPKLMGPIEELAYMDLVTFRRLDPSPARRIAKLEEKIALLEKEGIDKKIEAIRSWRQNPVSKTYLSMGQESIGGGKNIDDIIKDRKAQGLNYLTKEEFEAVMDLNNNLRF